MAKLNVGRSSRSAYKHWVLDAHLGKIVGSITTGQTPARANPLLCVDLCAGDGGNGDGTASPLIIHKHCEWLASNARCPLPAHSIFIEKNATTHDILVGRLGPMATHPNHRREIRNEDAREFYLQPTTKDQAIFINCDPNSISDMPLAEELAHSLTPTTTMTMTLGCNVGGLKRMELDKRQPWLDYVKLMTKIMPAWHDAILVEICGDASQWAYLTRLPSKWSTQQKECLRKGGEKLKDSFPQGVRVASFRQDRLAFDECLNRLFLTQKERARV